MRQVKKLERKLPIEYICDTDIDYKDVRWMDKDITKSSRDYTDEQILDYVVDYARRLLLSGMEVKESFTYLDVTGDCNIASDFVNTISQKLKLSCQVIKISPGYLDGSNLYAGYGYHYLNIISIRDKSYLVDITYKQFFKDYLNCYERMGVPLLVSPKVGCYMLLDDFDSWVAQKLLKDGWIELNDRVLKSYCDAFSLSFRNGLYYENLGKVDYCTDYSAIDYRRFLNGEDNQINHENKEFLGFQRVPLKNSSINFQPGK